MFTLFPVTVSFMYNIFELLLLTVIYKHLWQSSFVSSAYVLEKLHNCMFFDTEIQTSIFFPTLHDAVLHVLDKRNLDQRHNRLVRKTVTQVSDQIIYCQINFQNIHFN